MHLAGRGCGFVMRTRSAAVIVSHEGTGSCFALRTMSRERSGDVRVDAALRSSFARLAERDDSWRPLASISSSPEDSAEVAESSRPCRRRWDEALPKISPLLNDASADEVRSSSVFSAFRFAYIL